MRAQLEQRLRQRKTEFDPGQKRPAALYQKRTNLEETMLRISGAIPVLEERLAADAVALQGGCHEAQTRMPFSEPRLRPMHSHGIPPPGSGVATHPEGLTNSGGGKQWHREPASEPREARSLLLSCGLLGCRPGSRFAFRVRWERWLSVVGRCQKGS
jgi:hypothetical protein